MKILFVLHLPNPRPGAAWVRISFFAKYLKEKGHEVNIAGAFSLGSLSKAKINYWNDIRLLNVTPLIMLSNSFSLILNVISSFLTSLPLILFVSPNVVVISVPPGESAIGAFLASKILGKKIIFDYRDEWEDYKIVTSKGNVYRKLCKVVKKIMNFCYKKSDLVITVTNQYYSSLLSLGIKKIQLISNGADCKIFRPYEGKKLKRNSMGFTSEDFIIVYSGGIGRYYKIDLVIKALCKLISKFPGIKLLVIGYYVDSQTKDIVTLSKEYGINNNVIFLGAVDDKNELATLLSSCDVGIIPYDDNILWKNSLPVKSLEYLACGLPIIATAYTDSLIGKLIQKNNIGMISKPGDIVCLMDTIEKMYNSDLISAGQRAVSLINTHYDRNKIAKEFLALLEDTVSK